MGSYNIGKDVVCEWIRGHFDPEDEILDVGACDGKWRRLLDEYRNMDAVEVFRPYAEKLTGYRKVYIEDVCCMKIGWYDLIIFGDVIEHMNVEDAQGVIEYAWHRCKDMIIAVPWRYIQGPVDGNPWQEHIQDDLTPEIFAERYPGFEVIFATDKYAYFHKGEAVSG